MATTLSKKAKKKAFNKRTNELRAQLAFHMNKHNNRIAGLLKEELRNHVNSFGKL